MILKDLIEERDRFIKERDGLFDELDKLDNYEEFQQYNQRIQNADFLIEHLVETLPTISLKEFNDMVNQIFKKYDIDSELSIWNNGYSDKDKERSVDFILNLKRENSASEDNYKLASQTVRRTLFTSASVFSVMLNEFISYMINPDKRPREWKRLIAEYPEFKEVLYEVISQAKINDLTRKKKLIVRMIEKQNTQLSQLENGESTQANSTPSQTDIKKQLKANNQELNALNTMIENWTI